MITAIVGSREWKEYSTFRAYMNNFLQHLEIDMVVSGGASGVDYMAYLWSIEKGITFVCHPPKPEDGYPKKFFKRNLVIAEHCEQMIAFPKGKSTGTRHAIEMAKRLNRKVFVVEIDNGNKE